MYGAAEKRKSTKNDPLNIDDACMRVWEQVCDELMWGIEQTKGGKCFHKVK